MGLYDAARLFGFEVESSDNLTFIPLAVRFNLDRFGMRITLDQWQQLHYDDRVLLARFPVEDDADLEKNFDLALEEMMKTHANAAPERIERDPDPVWAHADAVPETVIRQSSLCGVSAPSLSRWGKARPLPAVCARETLAQHGQGQPRLPARDARVRLRRVTGRSPRKR
ncbi:NAD-dependent aldehyde dehydrogenase associated with FdhD [Candidatus Paraburkholderia kirkii]|nr:NAD-dependent aldehyde dehydrogenase associated with FdhD [Candidatus Paraburkholderia kirkii]